MRTSPSDPRRPGPPTGPPLLVGLAAPLAVALVLVLGEDPSVPRRPLEALAPGDTGAGRCGTCHPDHLRSWEATYHSRMTRPAWSEFVRGVFDGRIVPLPGGGTAVPEREGKRFRMRWSTADGRGESASVALVVGSHVFQQYFERLDGPTGFALRRLPLLWHVQERRWMPVSHAFLHPAGTPPAVHAALWNENCIFCHNTRPRPGRLLGTAGPGHGSFASRVSELGIACEACHGPGRDHAERHAGPLERLRARRDGRPDPTIVLPTELDVRREAAVCGQCHAQRLPRPLERIADYLEGGPTFRPGDLLEDHVTPLTRDTPSLVQDDPDLFRRRFWADGTPRLTAYEYQGLVASPCFRAGALSCGACHAMHGDPDEVDPRGQVRPEARGDGACAPCHAAELAAGSAHTGHDPRSPGARCVACHMPRIVYGLLDARISHRIESPDPRRDVEAGRPHACTLCHADRTAAWSAREMTRIFGRTFEPPRARPDGAPLDVPEALASLHAGDVLTRAIVVRALGPRAGGGVGEVWKAAHLAIALGDGYPAIRRLARRTLLEFEREFELDLGLSEFLGDEDLFTTPERLRAAVAGVLDLLGREHQRWPAPPPGVLVDAELRPDLSRVRALLDLQPDHPISIGE